MTGKFLINDPGPDIRKHVHLVVHFENGLQVRFCDPRRFGRVWFVEQTGDDLDASMLAGGMTRLGPEPFDLNKAAFREILRGGRPVKALLLDQMRIAGLGNIYTDEALYAARIHPATPAGQIGAQAAGRLLAEMVRVLNLSIEQGGTTFSDYRNPYGDMGAFRRMLEVYGREGEACRRCGAAIERVVIIGRSSHFCPRCQIALPQSKER